MNSTLLLLVSKHVYLIYTRPLNLCFTKVIYLVFVYHSLYWTLLIQWIIWKRPLAPWVKLNIDGASKDNPRISGSRGILLDCNSKFIVVYREFLSIQTFVIAEAMAFLLGIKLAGDMGNMLLWIESDSLFFVNVLNNITAAP